MGARGKKRVRANGQVASGKLRPLQRPGAVPPVEVDQLREGFEALRLAVAQSGEPETSSPEWVAAYRVAQERLHAIHSHMLADAILWRATFLDSLIAWDEFQEDHAGEGELPTPAMLSIAATIPTYGDDTSFDFDLFERRLATAQATPIE